MGDGDLLTVPVPLSALSLKQLHAAFEAAYWQRFGVELIEIRPELVNLRCAVIGRRRAVDLKAIAAAEPKAALRDAQVGVRQVWFAGDTLAAPGGFVETPVYRREWLPDGAQFIGPAIVEQLDCTTVVEPGAQVQSDALGNLVIAV